MSVQLSSSCVGNDIHRGQVGAVGASDSSHTAGRTSQSRNVNDVTHTKSRRQCQTGVSGCVPLTRVIDRSSSDSTTTVNCYSGSQAGTSCSTQNRNIVVSSSGLGRSYTSNGQTTNRADCTRGSSVVGTDRDRTDRRNEVGFRLEELVYSGNAVCVRDGRNRVKGWIDQVHCGQVAAQ